MVVTRNCEPTMIQKIKLLFQTVKNVITKADGIKIVLLGMRTGVTTKHY